MKKVIGLLAFLGISILLWQCHSNEAPVAAESENAHPDMDTTGMDVTDRVAAVQECAACHQQEYKEWLKGPHANAYTSLMEHLEYIQKSPNFSQDYKTFLPDRIGTICASCHTGQNSFETSFVGLDKENDPKKFTTEHYPKMHDFALVRKGDPKKNLSTGVDCLTCHKSGERILTRADYKASGKAAKGQCNVVASTFFSSNQSCYNCHHWQVSSMERLVKEKKLKSEQNCLECHLEKDADGKNNHYFYWRKDPKEKQRPTSLGLFANARVKAIKSGAEWQVSLRWVNDYIPHDFSECGEAVARVEVYNSAGKKVHSFEERVNLKSYLSKNDVAHFQEGTLGHEFIYKDPPIEHKVMLRDELTGGKIKVYGLVKPQYWSKDAELEQVYFEEIKIP